MAARRRTATLPGMFKRTSVAAIAALAVSAPAAPASTPLTDHVAGPADLPAATFTAEPHAVGLRTFAREHEKRVRALRPARLPGRGRVGLPGRPAADDGLLARDPDDGRTGGAARGAAAVPCQQRARAGHPRRGARGAGGARCPWRGAARHGGRPRPTRGRDRVRRPARCATSCSCSAAGPRSARARWSRPCRRWTGGPAERPQAAASTIRTPPPWARTACSSRARSKRPGTGVRRSVATPSTIARAPSGSDESGSRRTATSAGPTAISRIEPPRHGGDRGPRGAVLVPDAAPELDAVLVHAQHERPAPRLEGDQDKRDHDDLGSEDGQHAEHHQREDREQPACRDQGDRACLAKRVGHQPTATASATSPSPSSVKSPPSATDIPVMKPLPAASSLTKVGSAGS